MELVMERLPIRGDEKKNVRRPFDSDDGGRTGDQDALPNLTRISSWDSVASTVKFFG
jgi:hypothetical protein